MSARRRLWNFAGGVRLETCKQEALAASIGQCPLPNTLYVPLSSASGEVACPVVTVGMHVLKGQLIADAVGAMSLPVHAPSSGVITDINLTSDEKFLGENNTFVKGPTITIATDGQERWAPTEAVMDFTLLERQNVLSRIRSAGVVGMGGAGFPTAVKLAAAMATPVSLLIINGAECEPYLCADERLMQERAEEIIAGIEIIRWLVQAQNVVVAIEDTKRQALSAMQKACRQGSEIQVSEIQGAATKGMIEVVAIPARYPSGSEKQLVFTLTGQEVPHRQTPLVQGVLCQNVSTVIAVANAVLKNQPLISRVITLNGEGFGNKGTFEVLIGTPIADLLQLGRYTAEPGDTLLLDGPLTGSLLPNNLLATASYGIEKHSLGLVALKSKHPTGKQANCGQPPAQATERPCIRCGQCADVCPMQLLPQQLFVWAKKGDYDKAQSLNLVDCIECGACDLVCPSEIPLMQNFKQAKASLQIAVMEQQAADQARSRFAARQAREQRLEEARQLKRAQREIPRATVASMEETITSEPQPVPELPPDLPYQNVGISDCEKYPLPQRASISAEPREQLTASEPVITSPANLTKLKTAWNTAEKRCKDAEKAMQVARKSGNADIHAMRDKVEKLRMKADEAKLAYEMARDSQSNAASAGPTQESGE